MPAKTPPIRTRYTSRQRSAVIAAQLEASTGPMRAAELLNAGQLEDARGPIPAPTPPMPATTAADLARRERRRRERLKGDSLVIESPAAARQGITRRAVALVDRELTRLERKRSGTKASDLAAILRLAKEANALLRAEELSPKSTPAQSPSAPPSSHESEEPEPETLEAQIAREESARRRSRRPPSNPSHTSTPIPMHSAHAEQRSSSEEGARPLVSPTPDRALAELEPSTAAIEPTESLPGALEPPRAA